MSVCLHMLSHLLVYAPCASDVHRGQKKVLGPLDVDLQAVTEQNPGPL